VDISDSTTAELRFIHGDKNIETEMSADDFRIITEIFKGKVLFSDVPSCGFSKDIAVLIDNQTFCLACDDCGLVYLSEKDKYFDLSEEENKKVREILTSYGFHFPCV
jgi:hypothetical protein